MGGKSETKPVCKASDNKHGLLGLDFGLGFFFCGEGLRLILVKASEYISVRTYRKVTTQYCEILGWGKVGLAGFNTRIIFFSRPKHQKQQYIQLGTMTICATLKNVRNGEKISCV